MTATTNTPATPDAKTERTACLCGCGGYPAKPTSRYLPGHDAKHHSALKRAANEQDRAKPRARRGKATAE